jgi:radical SAM protein with 4Fe4S-binding SPASM domain
MPLKGIRGNVRSVKRLVRILWNYRMAQSYTVPYPPYRLWVEPTALCNLQCSYCPNKELIGQQNVGFMSFSLFQKIIDEARNWVHDINVHHRGEALLHPQFIEMVNYAGANGVFTKLHTNATRLNHEMSEAMLDSSLDLISFSFDGFEKATYERYRQPAKFEVVLDNILEFLRMKEQRGQRRPFTIVEAIEYPDSASDFSPGKRRAFLRKFEGLPLDRFVLKKPHNWGGSVTVDGDMHGGSFMPCTFLWHSLVIMWDGKVGPCPHDYMGKIILGDASSQDLASVFNSPMLKNLREGMIHRQLQDWLPCNKCDTVRRRGMVGLPVQSIKYLKH